MWLQLLIILPLHGLRESSLSYSTSLWLYKYLMANAFLRVNDAFYKSLGETFKILNTYKMNAKAK